MKFKYILSVSTAVLLFSGCGSGSSDSTPATSTTLTGQFVDSAVQGLEYSCSSGTSNVTNINGDFTCKVGDNITFSINGFVIGDAMAQEIITPKTLQPTDATAMVNIAQLLQTLDSDNNPNNGITLDNKSSEVQALTALTDVNLTQIDFDSAITTYIGKALVDETTANEHLNLSLQNIQNSTGTLTELSAVVILNNVAEEICQANNPYERSYDGYTDFADFLNAGGSMSLDYYTDEVKSCSSYSSAGFCQEQDYASYGFGVSGTGSCVQVVTFPNAGTTIPDTNTTTSAEVTYSEFTTKYKPMMPNLRSDNVWFDGTASTANSSIDVEYQAMTAEPKVADVLYFMGGNPLYGYEMYIDTYIVAGKVSTYYFDSQTNYMNNEGEWSISIVDNVHTKDGDTKSSKFSKPIATDTLHQMYLEFGLDIPFDSNDKAQFMLTSDSISYGHISLGLNESAYIKVMAALTP